MSTIITTVEKNDLANLDFNKTDVLTSNIDKTKRKHMLERALRLGTSIESKKSRIVFVCKDGIKKVEGKIIALSKSRITLKGHNRLPVKSVIGIDTL